VAVAVCVPVAVVVAAAVAVADDVMEAVCDAVGVGSAIQLEASQNELAKNSLPSVQLCCGCCEQPPCGSSQQSP